MVNPAEEAPSKKNENQEYDVENLEKYKTALKNAPVVLINLLDDSRVR